jgi:predicted HicB family RNase H-like nuclease
MTNMTKNTHREFRIRKIPEDLYKQVKISAVLKGLSVNELFHKAMKQVVAKNKGRFIEKNNMGRV